MTVPLKPLSLNNPRILSYRASSTPAAFESQSLAVRSLGTLGPPCMVFGFGAAATFGFLFSQPDNLITFPAAWIPVALATLLGILGIAYTICGKKIRRGSGTAASVALILAACHEGVILLLGFPGLILLFQGEFLVAFVFLAITLIFTIGLADLMLHLFHFIRWRRRLQR